MIKPPLAYSRVSSLFGAENAGKRKYVVYCARNPEKGSEFEQKTKFLMILPNGLLFWVLVLLGYDGFILSEGETAIGHIFFQKHHKQWKVFSIFISLEFRDNKYAKGLVKEFLNKAYQLAKWRRLNGVMLGNGGNDVVKHFWELAIDSKLGLDFRMRAGSKKGSLEFTEIIISPLHRPERSFIRVS